MTASTAPERAAARAVLVREATLADLETVVELRLALLREYADHPLYEDLHPRARERAFEAFQRQLLSPHQVILLARRPHAPAAEGILRCVESASSALLLPDRYCFVSSVFVRPEARRAGLLRALLQAAQRWARERGLPEMRLHSSTRNADAIGAWDALGFEVVEQVRRKRL